MKTTPILRIALLHLAPVPADVANNRRMVERAVVTAAGMGANWIITPELCICGYSFADSIGTAWIKPQPDEWMTRFCGLVAQLNVTVFLSHPERDRETGKLYNTVFVVAPSGGIIGNHRKINTLPVGSESWSTPGNRAVPMSIPPYDRVGILICADAYPPEIARDLQAQGAQILVSPAAWAPGLHGPNGEWERRSLETGLPLFVCNRTGSDVTLNFEKAETVLAQAGEKRFAFSSARSTIVLLDWDLDRMTLASSPIRTVELNEEQLNVAPAG